MVHFVPGRRHIPYGDWHWWESTMALWSRGAAESIAFDIDGDGGHCCTCKIRCWKKPEQKMNGKVKACSAEGHSHLNWNQFTDNEKKHPLSLFFSQAQQSCWTWDHRDTFPNGRLPCILNPAKLLRSKQALWLHYEKVTESWRIGIICIAIVLYSLQTAIILVNVG